MNLKFVLFGNFILKYKFNREIKQMNTTKVLIADESRIVTEWLKEKISEDETLKVIAVISDISKLKEKCIKLKPNVLLVNAYMRYGASCLKIVREIKKEMNIKIILMSDYSIYPISHELIDTDDVYFWNRNNQIIPAPLLIREVLNDDINKDTREDDTHQRESNDYSQRNINNLRRNVRLGSCMSSDFTSREMEVLELLVNGYPYGAIGERIGKSINTVKYNVKCMLDKTGYRNATILIANAVMKQIALPD